MEWLNTANLIIGILFAICYSHQFFYVFVSLFKKPKVYEDTDQSKKYAVLISARNESEVIGHLLDSIADQDYPKENIKVFVVADNCTDDTATVSRSHGAEVYERFNRSQIGKGYALNFLLKKIDLAYGMDAFDGYFIVDADNLLCKNYVTEMDKCFSAGNRIITSYRNSKNYAANWISSGYALWFLREARQLNNPRSLLHTSCAVSGTGFLVSRDIFIRQGGWKHHLLIEDIEFTIDNVLAGEKVAYCHAAMLYDEQPVKFTQSFRQRMRWTKGYLQVLRQYGGRLIRGMFSERCTSCYDMFMNITPAYFLSLLTIVGNTGMLLYSVLFSQMALGDVLFSILSLLLNACGVTFLLGLLTGITEWKNIHASPMRKIWSFITFPLFMLTYIPVSIAALFVKVEWKPIEHHAAMDLCDVTGNDAEGSGNEKAYVEMKKAEK